MKVKLAIQWAAALTVLFVGLHLAGCGGGGGGSDSSSLSRTAVGYVKDAGTLNGVAGAGVTIGIRSATTASDGRYQISGLPSGDLVRRVTASGYGDYADGVSLEPGVNTLTDVYLVEAPPLPPPPQ